MKTTIKIIIIATIGLVAGLIWNNYLEKQEQVIEQNNMENVASSTLEVSTTTDTIFADSPAIVQIKDPETGNRIPSRYACIGEYCDGSMYGDNHKEIFTVIQVPLIKDGTTIGCGADIFYAPHAVPKTEKVLETTYSLLFDIKHGPEISTDGFRNTVAGFEKTFFDKVVLNNGIAKVYLTGSVMSPGICADPEFKAQIEAAAFQFDSVKEVQVYLNDKRFDWCILDLSDGEGPCKAGPQYWITVK
ncbi:hypothetical protein SDC9_07724 [bioreactor metagenome]|uniref:GerMN domain-containing protein n=1 Tax=bioreactor metagenome TaxID=1076179 RepID=A0A644T5C1_9ZZZZ|nr:hypothetical protein [Candidatus Elulimicrobiales bacterium]